MIQHDIFRDQKKKLIKRYKMEARSFDQSWIKDNALVMVNHGVPILSKEKHSKNIKRKMTTNQLL